MSVKSAQAVTVLFTTANASTGAATDATGDPAGTLYVNGTTDAASVTVTKITTGVYKAAVTLPALSAGDQVSLRIAATVATVAGEGVIWQETADTYRTSDIETLVDDLETNLATTDGKADQLVAAVITNAAGTDIAADIIALKTVADTIQADTDLLDDAAGGIADIHTDVAAVKTVVDAVKTKTDYLPAATAGAAGGLFIAGTNAPVTITGSGNALTLTSTGANGKGLAAFGNGSGQGIYAKGGATGTGLSAVGGNTSGTGITASAVGSGVGFNAYSAAGSAIKAVTEDGLGMEIVGTTGDIDANEITAIKAIADKVDTAMEADAAVYRFTANALEQAPSGGLDAAATAAAVWDAVAASYDDADSMGAKLNDAGAAGDPWATPIPGAYGAGTAGLLLGTTIPTAIDTVDNLLDTEVAAITAAVITNAAGTDIAADIIALKTVADTIQADTDLLDDAAGGIADIHTDLGTLTTTVGAVKTETAELKAAVITNAAGTDIAADIIALKAETVSILADTNELQTDLTNGGRLDLLIDAIKVVTDGQGATGSGLSAVPWNAAWDAEVQSEATDALNAYDPPTNAEMEARTLAAADYVVVGDTIARVTLVDTCTTNTDMVTEPPTTVQIKTALEAEGSSLASILEDTGTTLPAAITALTEAGFKKNTAVTGFPIYMTDSTTHKAKTGLTVTAERSLDGAAFAACANSVAEVSDGAYKINLAQADTNGDVVMLKFTASGADDLVMTIKTSA